MPGVLPWVNGVGLLLCIFGFVSSGDMLFPSQARTIWLGRASKPVLRLRGGGYLSRLVGKEMVMVGKECSRLTAEIRVGLQAAERSFRRAGRDLKECIGLATCGCADGNESLHGQTRWRLGLEADSSTSHSAYTSRYRNTSAKFAVPESLSLDMGLSHPDDEARGPDSRYTYSINGIPLGRAPDPQHHQTHHHHHHHRSRDNDMSNTSAAFEVMLECLPSGVPARWITIGLHRKHCRMMRPDVEAKIDELWEAQCNSSARLYDGKLFRFGSCQRRLDADGTQEVKLEFGVTQYRSFMGTNMAPGWEKIPQEHMANPISCVAIVHTSDFKVMLIRRSDKVVTAQRAFALPGGYISPDRANLHDSIMQVPLPTDDNTEIKCVYGYSLWPGCQYWRPVHVEGCTRDARPYSSVVTEFFDAPVREACEELGLPPDAFPDPPLLLGITRSRRNLRTCATFYLRTPLHSKDVIQYHDRFHSFESDECIAIKERNAVPSIDLYMPSCSRGGLHLFAHWLSRKLHKQTDPLVQGEGGLQSSSRSLSPWCMNRMRSPSVGE